MHPHFLSQQHYRNSDDDLFPLHTKLSLKETHQTKLQPQSKKSQYDSLFQQFHQRNQFNQLFDNSFYQNHLFSQIDEHAQEEDSLFNDQFATYLQQNKSLPNKQQAEISKKMPIDTLSSKQDTNNYIRKNHFQHKDTNRILEILEMRDSKQNKIAETRKEPQQSKLQTKNNPKPQIIKPKISSSTSSSSIKFASKPEKAANSLKRIKTQSNQNHTSSLFSDRCIKQICKTEYDNNNDVNEQKTVFCMIQEDSLQCTFKPSRLKECLNQMKSIPLNNKKEKQNIKAKFSNNSLSLKTKMTDKERKSLEVPKQRVVLSKKSSAQASKSSLDVVSRNQLWLLQKQERLNQKRKQDQEEKQKRQDFSFKPTINAYKKELKNTSKALEKDIIPPFFQRLSMAKRKNTGIIFKKDQISDNLTAIERDTRQKNKENLVTLVNFQKDNFQVCRNKKASYEEAVKQLHSRIMKMNL